MAEFKIGEKIIDVVYDQHDRFYTSKWNLQEEVKKELNLPKTITFVDSTLREGAETPYVSFSKEEKVEIVKALEEVGISEIDCGLATLSSDHAETLQSIKNSGCNLKTMIITRLDVGDPKQQILKGIEAGADVLELSIYGSPIPGFSTSEDYLNLVENSAAYAKECDAYCAFWVPGNHWNPQFVLDLYTAAIRGGADRVDVAGTGCVSPTAMKEMVRKLKKIAGDKPVGLHCHNHYGVATACALSGVEAGAEVIHTSINGMSDGAGLTAFEEVVMCLYAFYGFDLGIDLKKLTELSKLIQEISGQKVQGWKPVVGPNVFVETPDSHLELILRERMTNTQKSNKSQWVIVGMKPEAVGQEVKLIFGKEALGGRGVKAKAELMGKKLNNETFGSIMTDIKEMINNKGPLSENEVSFLIEKHTS
jgi:methanogen homocitrate synthase